MESVQKTIEIPYYVDKLSLLGPKDSFLNLIRQDTAVKIAINNEEEISLYGPIDEVKRIESVLEKLMDIAANREPMTTNEVGILLNQSKNVDGIYRPQDDSLILKYGKKEIRAKTQHQMDYIKAIEQNIITFAIGYAGTAKTFLAVVSAIKALKEKQINRIVLSRPPIALQGYDIGFIPGTDNAKMAPWIAPLLDVLGEFYPKEKIEEMIDKEIISTIPLAYIRGRSFRNAFIILDEAQNASIEAFKSIMTRLDADSKLVICGDTQQTDINGKTGLEKAAHIMEGAKDVAIIRMGYEDIVRSGITAEVIKRFMEAGY